MGGMRAWDDFLTTLVFERWKIGKCNRNRRLDSEKNYSVLIHDNKMWLIGGAESSRRADQLPGRFLMMFGLQRTA